MRASSAALRALWVGVILVMGGCGGAPGPAEAAPEALPAGQPVDLAEARREGALLASILETGRDGDWRAAEARAAATGDPVIADIVLWRKLRAGEGTAEEYRRFVARRDHWPGQAQLRSAVFGNPTAPVRRGVAGPAADNWRAFDRAWRKRDYDRAAVLLDSASGSVAGLGDPERWGDRRRRLARRAAREGSHALAYRLAARHHLGESAGYVLADNEWIAGWVALRLLRDPAKALPHFERFEQLVETPISLGRAGYWLGRTHEALGMEAQARAAYARGARHQTSFYGQLSAVRIGAAPDQAIAEGGLPDWRTVGNLRRDDVRMATLLHFAGEDNLAFQSFGHLGTTLDGVDALGGLGALAIELGKPHYAVRVAKRAARRGIVLHPVYYPLHELADYATEIEPALAMSIARQETELNQNAVSPAGARGLMQLMPRTAQRVAERLGEPYSRARLTEDWRYNARLGQRYLAERIRQFGGSYVLAAAAYNAGPHRVDQWIAAYGDPRLPGVDVIDWSEMIPFSETRNYVQRVLEGLYIYRTRIAGRAGPMTIANDLRRGARLAEGPLPRPVRIARAGPSDSRSDTSAQVPSLPSALSQAVPETRVPMVLPARRTGGTSVASSPGTLSVPPVPRPAGSPLPSTSADATEASDTEIADVRLPPVAPGRPSTGFTSPVPPPRPNG